MILPGGVRVAWRAVPSGTPRRQVSRALMAEMLPGASFVSRCAACGGDHGRVRVRGADATASVSYTRNWAVVAVLFGAGRVGVDAVDADAAGLDRVLPGADARAWARVEAVLKADGRGLEVDPARVRLADAVDGAWSASVDDGPVCTGHDVIGPPGVVVAVAMFPAAPGT